MMKPAARIEEYRICSGEFASRPGSPYGAFKLPGPCGEQLVIIAADASTISGGWEHVSVSTRRRVPNWAEMCFVKNLFWSPDDCVVQFHPPQADYVNLHPNVLHLWSVALDKG